VSESILIAWRGWIFSYPCRLFAGLRLIWGESNLRRIAQWNLAIGTDVLTIPAQIDVS